MTNLSALTTLVVSALKRASIRTGSGVAIYSCFSIFDLCYQTSHSVFWWTWLKRSGVFLIAIHGIISRLANITLMDRKNYFKKQTKNNLQIRSICCWISIISCSRKVFVAAISIADTFMNYLEEVIIVLIQKILLNTYHIITISLIIPAWLSISICTSTRIQS